LAFVAAAAFIPGVLMLVLDNVSFVSGGKSLVEQISCQLKPGELCMLLGANGAGKSTLLSLIAGLRKPSTGKILWKNQDIQKISNKILGTQRGWLAQQSDLHFPLPAQAVVEIGASLRGDLSAAQRAALVKAKMQDLDCWHLAQHPYSLLSGGERQRVQLARVFVQIQAIDQKNQEPRLLLLDEALASLDINHQKQLLTFLQQLKKNYLIVLAIHDLSLAWRYGDRFLALKSGKLFADVAKAAIDEDLIEALYGVKARLHPDWGIVW
jgi:iron complex transport system ATP-binding protein